MKPSHVTEALCLYERYGGHLYLEGPPGIGKSALVESAARTMRRKLYAPRVAQFDSVDVRGFPMPDMQTRTMEFLASSEFPWCPCIMPANATDDSWCKCDPSILFLDEFSQCSIAVQNACLQLVHRGERRVGQHKLPPLSKCFLVLAGNRAKDRAGAGKLTSAIMSRFLATFPVEPDLDDLLSYALAKGWHAAVHSWLRACPQFLCPPLQADVLSTFPCPRTHEALSDAWHLNPPLHLQRPIASGTIGEEAAASFLAHATVYAEIPDVETEILAKPTTAHVPSKAPALSWGICGAIVSRMRDCVDEKRINAMLVYADRLDAEFGVMLVADAMRAGCRVTKTDAGKKWAHAHRGVLLSAIADSK